MKFRVVQWHTNSSQTSPQRSSQGRRKVAVVEAWSLWGGNGIIRHLFFGGATIFFKKRLFSRYKSRFINETETGTNKARYESSLVTFCNKKMGFSVHRSSVVTVPYRELAVSGSSTEVKIEKYRRQWHKGTELYRSHYSCLNQFCNKQFIFNRRKSGYSS